MENNNKPKPITGDVILCFNITKYSREHISLYECTKRYWNHKLQYVRLFTNDETYEFPNKKLK